MVKNFIDKSCQVKAISCLNKKKVIFFFTYLLPWKIELVCVIRSHTLLQTCVWFGKKKKKILNWKNQGDYIINTCINISN